MHTVADFSQFSIPKTARVPSRAAAWAAGGLWFFRASLVIGMVSLLAAGGLVAYRRTLEVKRDRWVRDVRAEESALETPLYSELVNLSRSITSARQTLAQHLFMTRVFGFLREATHPRVQFSNLHVAQESSMLELVGVAASYRTVAEQVSILESRREVGGVDFGGLSLDPRGLVNFRLSIAVTPTLFRPPGGGAEAVLPLP